MPILNRNRGAIAEAEARRSESAAKFLALQARVIGELDRAVVSYRGAFQKVEVANALLAGQEKQQQSAEALLKAGESDRLSLLSSQIERDASALSRIDALVEAQQSLGQLEDALQTELDSR